MCLFNCQGKNKKLIYANVYRNTINDGDSQTSLPIFPEGGGTSVHRLLTDRLIDQLTVDVHRRLENKFDLYYYDGLARQDEELRLTVGEHAFLRVNRHSVTYVVLVRYIAVTS